jgi:sugar lactone lactonase YvrE
VANFDGAPEGDANGFITRAGADGTVDSLRFMMGTASAPLHGPRGMFITGDTLWAADAVGVHGFNRRTGAPVAFVDFSAFEPGFLNDIAQGPDGALYVTDTGKSQVYRLAGRDVTVAVETPSPNGITWDSAGGRFLLASWTGGPSVRSWVPGGPSTEAVGSEGAGRFDGIELAGGRLLVASQTDSTIQLVAGTDRRAILRVAGHPADIAIDTRRNRVAVPYISLNRVDIWEIPR